MHLVHRHHRHETYKLDETLFGSKCSTNRQDADDDEDEQDGNDEDNPSKVISKSTFHNHCFRDLLKMTVFGGHVVILSPD